MTVSVVVVANRRMETLGPILEAWKKQSPDVWLADCSGIRYTPPAGIHYVHFSPDPGNRTRHALAPLTEGDWVVKADDDVIPGPGLIEDFIRAGIDRGPCFLGVMGRRFEGPKYYGNTISSRAALIETPTRADFVGICTMAPRSVQSFDLRGCSSSIEELFQQCGAFPEVPKWVIVSKNYGHIKGADRPGCLCKDPKAQVEREAYYSKVWERCRAIRVGETANG
jgi:hypothetical protein